MEPTIERSGTVLIVRLPLEKLDLSTVAAFKGAMTALLATEKYVAIDMNAVQFVDSSGLGALLSLLRDLSGKGGGLKLFAVQRRVRAMFELVRLQHVLATFDSEADALRAFGKADGEK